MNYLSPALVLVCSLGSPLAIDLIAQPVRAHHTPAHVSTISRVQTRDRVKLHHSNYKQKSLHRSHNLTTKTRFKKN
jgi:hypothetical protein